VVHIGGYSEVVRLFEFLQKNSSLLLVEVDVLYTPKDEVVPVHNRNYSYQFQYLDSETTASLDLSGYACKPATFGYSITEGNKLFPPFTYPPCSIVTSFSESLLLLNRSSQMLSMNCSEPEKGFFFSGPVTGLNLMLRKNTFQLKLQKYQPPVNAQQLEFGLGLCSEEEIKETSEINPTKLHHASMSPVFNETLYEKSKSKVNGKPRLIFLLTLDSLSRRHFYRKLPKVVKFLNESEKNMPNFAVYDFLMHSTIGSNSVANQVPIFGGLNYQSRLNYSEADRLGKDSIWSKMKSKGYVTVMGFDDCDRWFPEIIGESLNVDYTIRQFYCLVKEYTGVRVQKSENEQRCVGPYQTHFYMLNYTLSLIRMYQGVNLWIYLHLNAGHENTGQHAATLDQDITDFLRNFIDLTEKYEVFMYLHADHGMRYGNWYRSLDAYQETRLPSMFLLASKNLLNRFPYSYHVLSENSRRLTSKMDVRETTLSLIGLTEKNNYSINWLREIASYSRDCQDIRSPSLYCACNRMTEVSLQNLTFASLANQVKWRVQEFLNSMSYAFPRYPPGMFCDQWSLDETFKIYHVHLSVTKEMFKFEFGTKKFPKVRLEVNVGLGINDTHSNVFLSQFRGVRVWLSSRYLVLVRVS
jgi:hypothetical protein